MRSLFPGYYPPTSEQFHRLLNEGMIVLDTNVLLGLYRRNAEARKAFFDVLNVIKSQLWIPFQVALEYQHHRPFVRRERSLVYDQLDTVLDEVQGSFQGRIGNLNLRGQDSQIDCKPALAAMDESFTELRNQIEAHRSQMGPLGDADPVREVLDSLLLNNVGRPPASQTDVNALNEIAKTRYEREVPPGYRDDTARKEKAVPLHYRDLELDRRYGDFFLWREIIEEARTREGLYGVLLVIDDRKDDWWWVNKGETLGPRPELANELVHESSVEVFWMYTPDTFLHRAGEALEMSVTTASVEAFSPKERATLGSSEDLAGTTSTRQILGFFAERAVFDALIRRFPKATLKHNAGFPDIIVSFGENTSTGYEVKAVSDGRNSRRLLLETLERFKTVKARLGLQAVGTVLVALTEEALMRITLDYRLGRYADVLGEMEVYVARFQFADAAGEGGGEAAARVPFVEELIGLA